MNARILAPVAALVTSIALTFTGMPVASASPLSGETKSYTLKVTEAYSVDLGDSGASHGDIAVRNGVIRSATGKKVGTFTSIQIIVGKDSTNATEDRQSSMQFNFAGGSIMTMGTIRAPQGGGLVTDHEFAVVGGTGKFAGAMGTMKVSPLTAPKFKATFAFL